MNYCIVDQEGQIVREGIETHEEALRIRAEMRTNFNSLKILLKGEEICQRKN